MGSKPHVPVFSRCHARQGGFQILKRPFPERANTIPHLTHFFHFRDAIKSARRAGSGTSPNDDYKSESRHRGRYDLNADR